MWWHQVLLCVQWLCFKRRNIKGSRRRILNVQRRICPIYIPHVSTRNQCGHTHIPSFPDLISVGPWAWEEGLGEKWADRHQRVKGRKKKKKIVLYNWTWFHLNFFYSKEANIKSQAARTNTCNQSHIMKFMLYKLPRVTFQTGGSDTQWPAINCRYSEREALNELLAHQRRRPGPHQALVWATGATLHFCHFCWNPQH